MAIADFQALKQSIESGKPYFFFQELSDIDRSKVNEYLDGCPECRCYTNNAFGLQCEYGGRNSNRAKAL